MSFSRQKAGLLRLTPRNDCKFADRAEWKVALPPRNDRTGFTLAEVLVTLGIIGVVSAMTVPSLMQNYQRQSYVTQLHKVYNEFSQALLRYQTDNNALNLKEAGLSSQDNVNSFINSYFKVVKECDTMDDCFATAYLSLNSGKKLEGTYDKNLKSYVLANGAAIRPYYTGQPNKIINLALDTNGPKGPNIVGRDFFFLYVYNNGLIDDTTGSDTSLNAPLSSEHRENMFNSSCLNDSDSGCFGKILNDNWQMNY